MFNGNCDASFFNEEYLMDSVSYKEFVSNKGAGESMYVDDTTPSSLSEGALSSGALSDSLGADSSGALSSLDSGKKTVIYESAGRRGSLDPAPGSPAGGAGGGGRQKHSCSVS
ncbi:hypothetical protein JYU34_014819 [Plutella xylostella]|uniref:Uncharacterized protein n=1 Tax=Plutella xylostella TaxID=51655 RepID=A0ABQ7Q9L6_PLUXY|nr:hypothetical protein JYU34_014819 [Plutella xylostella]